MTKREAKKQLDTPRRFWNSVRTVNGITVARVCWLNRQYRVVPAGTTFDVAKEMGFKFEKDFYYQDELINYLTKE